MVEKDGPPLLERRLERGSTRQAYARRVGRVVADIFADGHDELGAILRHRPVRGDDPRNMQHGLVRVPLDRLQASGGHPDRFEVRDLLDGTAYSWRGEWNYVRLDPGVRQAHVFALGAA